MKKSALLVAALTMMSVAAQGQSGQKEQEQQPRTSQSQAEQSQSQAQQRQQGQSQLPQSAQGGPGQSQSSSASSQQSKQSGSLQSSQSSQGQQSGQGQPGQTQSSSASSQQQSQGARGSAAQTQSQRYQSAQPSNLQQYIDYKVVDKQDKQIGTVEALWEDQTGQPAFLAIKRTGQAGQQTQAQQGQQSQQQLLVVPAQSAEVNRGIRTVRIPYTQQVLQSAPTFRSEEDLDRQAQMKITAFYRQHGYQDRQQQSSVGRPAQGTTERDQATIQLKEEDLKVGTRQVDAGGVILRKIVRTDTVSKPVELQREELVIERVEGTGRPVEGEIGSFQEGQIYIPLRREEAVVEKNVQVKDTFRVGKETETEQQKVSDQVREEQLQIIKEQGTDVQIEGEQQGQNQSEQEQQRRRQQQQQQQNRSNTRP